MGKKKYRCKIIKRVLFLIVMVILLGIFILKYYDGYQENTKRQEIDRTESVNSASEEVSKGKNVAIIGDSISAFSEKSIKGYATCYPAGDVEAVEQMWWSYVKDAIGLELTSIAAYSGGTCAGDSTDNIDGKVSCSDKRIADLLGPNKREPDIIILFCGINDFINATPVGDYYDDSNNLVDGLQDTFSKGYAMTLEKVKKRFPLAQVYCCTLMDARNGAELDEDGYYRNEIGLMVDDYNNAIRELASRYEANIVETAKCGIEYDTLESYTYDSYVHPNVAGMRLIADEIIESITLDSKENP